MADMTITKETKFAYKNVGYGLVSYEAGDDFDRYEDGKLYTNTFSSYGMEWRGDRWRHDSGFGMRSYLVRREDMTPEQIKEAWEDND
jgi:hypothetical protein